MGHISFLVYADDVNLLGDNIDTIKKNTQALTNASKELSLEANTEKTKYMLWPHSLADQCSQVSNEIQQIFLPCQEGTFAA
jgi:hypothetical protein